MGWTEEQALRSDVNAIIIGYEGRVDMWKSVFGGGEEKPQELPEFGPGMMGR